MKSDDEAPFEPVVKRETRPSARSDNERSLAGSLAIAWICSIASVSFARIATLAVIARMAALNPVPMFEVVSPVVVLNLEIKPELMD